MSHGSPQHIRNDFFAQTGLKPIREDGSIEPAYADYLEARINNILKDEVYVAIADLFRFLIERDGLVNREDKRYCEDRVGTILVHRGI